MPDDHLPRDEAARSHSWFPAPPPGSSQPESPPAGPEPELPAGDGSDSPPSASAGGDGPQEPPVGGDALSADTTLPPVPPTRPSTLSDSQPVGQTRRERRENVGSTRSKSLWVIGGLVLVAALVIGGVVVRRSSDSGSATLTPAETTLLRSAAVPASVRADCRGTTQLPAGATAGLVCSPVDGADRVRYYRFSPEDALAEYFDRKVTRAGVVIDAQEDCSQVVDVEHPYRTVRDLEGRVACYRSGGRSTLVWTMPEATAVGLAERFDTDDHSLYDWWNLSYQVELNPADQRVELTTGEIELLKRVPAEVRTTCGPERASDVLRDAAASLACVVSDTDVYYTAFSSVEAMNAVYNEQLADAGIAVGTGGITGTDCPGEGPYRAGTPSQGSLFCFIDGTIARATWTDGLPSQLPDVGPSALPGSQWWILTEAIRRDDQLAALMTLVATLGPTA